MPRGFLVGRSIHTVAEAGEAEREGADYLIFGPVFETGSKPGVAPAGVGGLAAVVRATIVPILAVGGVTPDTAAAIGRAGAAGLAAIGMFAAARGENGVQETLSRARSAFDSGSRGS
ncbi:Regulatory protein TenI [compost metagenome]